MARKPKYYAVFRGRITGIFNTWEGGARLAVDRFPDAKHESFATLELAEEWYRLECSTSGSNHSPVFHFSTEIPVSQSVAMPQQAALKGVSAKKYVIYLIIAPDTDEPFYVGLTSDMERRQAAHLGRAKKNTKRAAAKIAQILSAGMTPIFKVVESCSSEEAALAAETRWVRQCTERGHVVWNRWKEHRDIQKMYRRQKIELDRIIGDGPILLGPYHYDSRFELKNKLRAFVAAAPQGAVNHPVAIEKLKLIWSLTKQHGELEGFRVVDEAAIKRLEAVLVTGAIIDFDYGTAVDRLP